MTSYWFKPHSYGYGATPANWRGLAATGAFLVILLSASLVLVALELKPGTGSSFWQIAAWWLGVAALTIGFVWLARAKTDGQWGWRWGK